MRMSSEAARIRVSYRVEWLDTNAAGVCHRTTVARFAEAAEAALHDALGIADETFGSTPRLDISFEFRRRCSSTTKHGWSSLCALLAARR
jgi:acyl-CoA thioesterase FadM